MKDTLDNTTDETNNHYRDDNEYDGVKNCPIKLCYSIKHGYSQVGVAVGGESPTFSKVACSSPSHSVLVMLSLLFHGLLNMIAYPPAVRNFSQLVGLSSISSVFALASNSLCCKRITWL